MNRAIKSLSHKPPTADEIAHRIAIMERGNGRINKIDNYDRYDPTKFKSPYPGVRYPNAAWFGTMIIEHPYWTPDDIVRHVHFRMKVRRTRPDMYKTPELARGDEYLPDEYEEYIESKLDAEQLERLSRQRARREKIGTIRVCEWNKGLKAFSYELDESLTPEEHRSLCEQHKDI